jgi:uncharacterized protein (TIGR02301 family)
MIRQIILAAIASSLAFSAVAQQRLRQQPPATQPAPAAPQSPPEPEPLRPYDPDLMQLSEVIGALAFMSMLCNERDADGWRQRMTEMIEAEGTTPQRKERLAGAFNRGYLGYQPTHRTCGDRSRQVIDGLIAKGQQLARDMSSKYRS